MTTALPYGVVVRDPEDGETLMVLGTTHDSGYDHVLHVTLAFPADPFDVGKVATYSLDFMRSRYEIME